jgi:pimeloyl-ACP methyl ester carboxylesterase
MKAMLAVIALSAATFAQEPNLRYGFLERLRSLESKWPSISSRESTTDDLQLKARAQALDSVVQAQAHLAADRIQECCRALDDAGRSYKTDAFTTVLQRRLWDRSEPRIMLHLVRLNRWTRVPGRHVIVGIDDGEPHFIFGDEVWDEPGPWTTDTLALDRVSSGDHKLTIGLISDDTVEGQTGQTVSIVEHRDERLAGLKASIEKLTDKAPALERETAKATLALLESLARGSTEAHEYPGARLLAETEQVVAAAAKGERWFTPERSGEFWLSLPIDGASVRTRVLEPEGLSKDKSAPLVVAFHGAAFDEDVWFDGYGAGAAVEACRKRGWIFAAPHCDGSETPQRVEAVIDALARVYPIDTKHVFLLAHSRGAGTALRAQAAKPERYRGVAAIGNALDDASAKALANHPLFLAAGDHDFAREAVTAMNKTLTDAGSKSVKLTIYPNTEHWLAVQAALPDAFAWFDALAK